MKRIAMSVVLAGLCVSLGALMAGCDEEDRDPSVTGIWDVALSDGRSAVLTLVQIGFDGRPGNVVGVGDVPGSGSFRASGTANGNGLTIAIFQVVPGDINITAGISGNTLINGTWEDRLTSLTFTATRR